MYQIKLGENVIKQVPTLGGVLAFLNHHDYDFKPSTVEEVSVSRDNVPMKLVGNSISKFGVQQEGSAQAIFEAMFKEIELFCVKPVDKVIPPYEMTRDQWNAVVAVRKAAEGNYPCFTADQLREPCQYDGADKLIFSNPTVSYLCSHLFRTRFGWNHNGPSYDGEGNVSSSHDIHVAYALAAGKHVPEWVLGDYRGPGNGTLSCTGKADWFSALIRVPHLRGAIPAEKLQILVSILGWDKIEITNENVGEFIQAMNELPDDKPGFIEVEDHLYAKGLIKPFGSLQIAPQSKVEAFSPLALDIAEVVAAEHRKVQIKHINKRRSKKEMSLRQYEKEMVAASLMGSYSYLVHANGLAKAVATKDLPCLLKVLDGPDDWNTASKRALQMHAGLKILGLKSAARTAAIYEFCGYSQEARAEYESKALAAAEKAKADRHEKEVTKLVESVWFRLSVGSVMNGKEFIEKAIHDGFTEITTTRAGKRKSLNYWLTNPSTGSSYPLLKKNGTVDYAQIAVARTAVMATVGAEAEASQQAA